MNTNISAPPLDGDLGSVKTDMPLLKDNEYYDVRVTKAEPKSTSSGGQMIAFTYETIAPAKSMEGTDLGPGIPVFDNLNIVPTGKATWDMVIRNAAGIAKAVGLTKEKGWDWSRFGANTQAQVANAAQWAPQILGKVLRIRVGYEAAGVSAKTGKAYKAKNVITAYVPQA